jgi:hypothetical protein
VPKRLIRSRAALEFLRSEIRRQTDNYDSIRNKHNGPGITSQLLVLHTASRGHKARGSTAIFSSEALAAPSLARSELVPDDLDLLRIMLCIGVLEGKPKLDVSATRRPSVRADPQGMQPG